MKALPKALCALSAAVAALSACKIQHVSRTPATDDSGSILASVPGIDKALGDKFDMTFKLLCGDSAAGALKEVATTTIPKDQLKLEADVKVKFTPTKPGDSITEGSYCAIDVSSTTDALDSEFKFRGAKNLFYASTRAQVAQRKLSVDIYRTFYKVGETPKNILVAATIKGKPSGKYQFALACDKSGIPASEAKDVEADKPVSLKFTIYEGDLKTPGFKCGAIEALREGTATFKGPLSSEITIATGLANETSVTAELKEITLDIDTSINPGEKCVEFDPATRDCTKTVQTILPERVALFANELTAPSVDLVSCEGDDLSRTRVFGTQMWLAAAEFETGKKTLVVVFKKKDNKRYYRKADADAGSVEPKILTFTSDDAVGTYKTSYGSKGDIFSLSLDVSWTKPAPDSTKVEMGKYWVSRSCTQSKAFADWLK